MSMMMSRECSQYLSVQNSLEFLHYQTLSGLGFNKLGLYEECIADPTNQFYLLQGDSDFFALKDQSPDHSFMSGLCFNRVCSAQDLEYALAALQEYIPKQPFQALRIETPSLIQQNYDITTIIVLSVLAILLLLFIGCSVVDIIRRKRRRGGQTQLIQIFSVLTVIRLLQSRSERNNERVKAFSGIKALSLAGIALANLGTIAYFAPTTSFYAQTQDESIYACFYGVDIWLTTSGFFLSYLLLKQHQKLQDKRVLLLKIVRRFLRLWPIYLICLFLNWNVLPLIGSGPLWPLLIDFPKKFCSTYTPHLFMLSNLTSDRCYNSLWLLQLDFQLCFIFVPLLLLYLRAQINNASRYVFYFLQAIFLIVALGAGALVDESKVGSLTQYFFLTEYYGWNVKPFVRCGGFLIGYNLGILYFQFKKSHHKQKFWLIKALKKRALRVGLPLAGVVGLAGVAISFHDLNSVALTTSYFLYFSMLRTVVPVLMILLILPSLFGFCSPIKSVCQSWVCNLMSKLSLSVYGIHYVISLYLIYYRQSDLQLSNFTIIFLAFCTLLPSAVLAIVLTSIIEIPVFICKKIYSKTERITYFEH